MASRLLTFVASLSLLSLLIPSALGKSISLHVEEGSNNIYFAVNVKYDGGAVNGVELKETNSPYPGADGWEPLKHSWGTIWRLDPNHPTLPPFSIRITDGSGNKLVAKDVIPPNWKPNTVYTGNLA